jgi:hypothetical protein
MGWLRHIQTPTCTLFCGLVAAASFASLPRGGGILDRSALKAALFPPRGVAAHPQLETWYLKRTDSAWSVLATPADSADELSREIATDPASVAVVTVSQWSIAEGLYAPTARTKTTRVRAAFASGVELEPSELRAAVVLLEQHGRTIASPTSLGYERGEARSEGRSILWAGMGHNALALVAWLLLPLSLAWIPRSIRDVRERQRLLAGLCPGCGYDRRATLPTATCPECGRAGAATPPA